MRTNIIDAQNRIQMQPLRRKQEEETPGKCSQANDAFIM